MVIWNNFKHQKHKDEQEWSLHSKFSREIKTCSHTIISFQLMKRAKMLAAADHEAENQKEEWKEV